MTNTSHNHPKKTQTRPRKGKRRTPKSPRRAETPERRQTKQDLQGGQKPSSDEQQTPATAKQKERKIKPPRAGRNPRFPREPTPATTTIGREKEKHPKDKHNRQPGWTNPATHQLKAPENHRTNTKHSDQEEETHHRKHGQAACPRAQTDERRHSRAGGAPERQTTNASHDTKKIQNEKKERKKIAPNTPGRPKRQQTNGNARGRAEGPRALSPEQQAPAVKERMESRAGRSRRAPKDKH